MFRPPKSKPLGLNNLSMHQNADAQGLAILTTTKKMRRVLKNLPSIKCIGKDIESLKNTPKRNS